MLTCVACGYMGRVVSLSLYYKTSKCSQMKDLKGRAFSFFFLCRERYRPSWIYVPVYVNLCLLKTSSASTGSSTITAECDPNYVIYKLLDELCLFVQTGENSEKLSRKGSSIVCTGPV